MGKAIALLYAKEGAKVVVTDINLDAAKTTVAEIKSNGGIATAQLQMSQMSYGSGFWQSMQPDQCGP